MRNLQIDSAGNRIASYVNECYAPIGNWVSFDHFYISTQTGVTFNTGAIRYYPINLTRPLSIDGCSMSVTSSGAGRLFKYALYDNDFSNGARPNNFLHEFPEADASTNGWKTSSISPLVFPAGRLWIGLQVNTTMGFTGFVNNPMNHRGLGSPNPSTNSSCCWVENSAYGTFPAVANPNDFDTRYHITLFRLAGYL